MTEKVFPAQVGMIPLQPLADNPIRCIPRAGGDDPYGINDHALTPLYSPRRWG